MRVRGTKEYGTRAIYMKSLARWHALSFFRANIFKACVYFDSVSIIKADREITIELMFFPRKREKRNIYIYYICIYVCERLCNYNFVIMDGLANDTLKSLLAL